MAEQNTFYAYFDRIAPAQNKYMACLFNTSTTRKAVIQKVIWLTNAFTVVTAVVHDMYLARITARTAGTAVTIHSRDSADTLSAEITADFNPTSVAEAYIIQRFVGTTEESVIAVTSLPTYLGSLGGPGVVLYARLPNTKGETLRQNQGLAIRTLTASTVGVMSFLIECTDEAA